MHKYPKYKETEKDIPKKDDDKIQDNNGQGKNEDNNPQNNDEQKGNDTQDNTRRGLENNSTKTQRKLPKTAVGNNGKIYILSISIIGLTLYKAKKSEKIKR